MSHELQPGDLCEVLRPADNWFPTPDCERLVGRQVILVGVEPWLSTHPFAPFWTVTYTGDIPGERVHLSYQILRKISPPPAEEEELTDEELTV